MKKSLHAARAKRAGHPKTLRLRLYVAGDAPNSVVAKANLTAILAGLPADAHVVEIVDVLTAPERCLVDGILLTPTLVKLHPPPVRHIVGNLNARNELATALGLTEQGP